MFHEYPHYNNQENTRLEHFYATFADSNITKHIDKAKIAWRRYYQETIEICGPNRYMSWRRSTVRLRQPTWPILNPLSTQGWPTWPTFNPLSPQGDPLSTHFDPPDPLWTHFQIKVGGHSIKYMQNFNTPNLYCRYIRHSSTMLYWNIKSKQIISKLSHTLVRICLI